MAPRKKAAPKVCKSCGKPKTLIKHIGKEVCSTCMNIRIAAKNNPQMVFEALEEFGHLPMVIKQRRELSTENQAMKDELEKLKTDLAEYMALVKQSKAREQTPMSRPDSLLAAEVETLNNKLFDATNMAADLMAENDELKKRLAEATDKDFVNMLANRIVSGSISGVTIDIRPIREAT